MLAIQSSHEKPMNMTGHEIRLLVLQSTPFCNLGCTYCYLSEQERASRNKMEMETIRQAAKFVKSSGYLGDRLTILWHAGEPLAMPIAYYKEAINVLQEEITNCKLKFNFQTNAVGLNQNWCDFIAENKISIGVSIDGPKDIHDQYRVTKKKQGTFNQTMKGIDMLKNNGISFGTISVITDKSLSKGNEIVDFLLSIGSDSIGFNIEESERYHTNSSLETQADHVKLFVHQICEILHSKKMLHKCREYRDLAQAILTDDFTRDVRRGENKLFSIINVSWNGNVSTYSPELCDFNSAEYGNFSFGNVSDGFDSFSKNLKLRQVYDDINSGIDKCKNECDYYNFCGGGAPSNKLHENGSFISTETNHCVFHKKLFVDQFIKYASEFA